MKKQPLGHLQFSKSCCVFISLFCALHVYAQYKDSATPAAPVKSAAPVKPAAPTAPVATCSASEFKALAYTINDAQLREERAKEWLSKYGKSCPMDQIEIILSNQAVWLGTADTPVIISAIETIYKQKKAAAQELANIVDKPRGNANNK
jgi:hypothetical protein